MLRFKRCDVRHCCEDVTGVRGCALDTVPVVDASFASLGVHIKVLQVVVKVDRAGAKVSSEESSMGGENSGDVNASLLGERQRDTGKPLVEVSNDSPLLLVANKLRPALLAMAMGTNGGC
jgi:hypothetical protein